MAHNPTRSKPSISESIGRDSILHALADPLRYDNRLIHLLTDVLKHKPMVPIKPLVKGKQTAHQTLDASDERRRFSMEAANAASQSLGTVIQSGWNASNPDVAGLSTDNIRSIVACFRLAISALREVIPRDVDVERVVSSFIGKLISIQFVSVIQSCQCSKLTTMPV